MAPQPNWEGGAVRALYYPEELARHCRKLAREARSAIEETGANMLFLVHGFLEFPDRDDSDRLLLAPLIAVPVTLEKAAGIRNVFVKDWKPNFFTDPRKKIASIPFIRNLIEFTKDAADPDFVKLTSLLHWKADTEQVTVADLDAIYNKVFSAAGSSANSGASVAGLIESQAAECVKAPEGHQLREQDRSGDRHSARSGKVLGQEDQRSRLCRFNRLESNAEAGEEVQRPLPGRS